jgi:CRISPR-associated protein Cas1
MDARGSGGGRVRHLRPSARHARPTAAAATPFHALINYAYAILETEATITLQAHGFDPGIGILHTDKRYRGSLAHDLMEPV